MTDMKTDLTLGEQLDLWVLRSAQAVGYARRAAEEDRRLNAVRPFKSAAERAIRKSRRRTRNHSIREAIKDFRRYVAWRAEYRK